MSGGPLSVLDLFKIGLGPSSSHTVGPMIAVRRFLEEIDGSNRLDLIASVSVELFGSLALTGRGHQTDVAILLGLLGERPDEVDTAAVDGLVQRIRREKSILLLSRHRVSFDEREHLLFRKGRYPARHPNTLKISAVTATGADIMQETYYSMGGGFVVSESEWDSISDRSSVRQAYPFTTFNELLDTCAESRQSIAKIVRANEASWRSDEELTTRLQHVAEAMDLSIERGLTGRGCLPGGLNVQRRAPGLNLKLGAQRAGNLSDPFAALDWATAFAIAVNEENAAGGRVVTAPTNGSAGVIPAVIRYHVQFCADGDRSRIPEFLLTAAAIGMLAKRNASISGAEVGCQGEIGVAAAMAAGGLAAVLDGTPAQIENAAEIALEHHLGMTCDPIGGLVQIPCIERNGMGALKAIGAASLALKGNGSHRVSFDEALETMRKTGRDMSAKYKETSRGGLAVTVRTVEC